MNNHKCHKPEVSSQVVTSDSTSTDFFTDLWWRCELKLNLPEYHASFGTEIIDSESEAIYIDTAQQILWELGAEGINTTANNALIVYFNCSETEFSLIKTRLINNLFFTLLYAGEQAQENWVQMCDDLLHPIVCGELKIIPVQSYESAPTDTGSKKELFIIPGFGFGTGHHESTKLILKGMQTMHLSAEDKVMDIGTGSGILAIYAAKTWGTKVKAIDSDSEALINCKENIALNQVNNLIELIHTSHIPKATGLSEDYFTHSFNLIVVNIYSTVIIKYLKDIKLNLAQGGKVLMSGIRLIDKNELIPEIDKHGLEVEQSYTENEWLCLILKYKSILK